MKIKRIPKFCKIFQASSCTAPEKVFFQIRIAINFKTSSCHRLKISCHSSLIIHAGQNRIYVGLLVIISVFFLTCDFEKLAGQFEHIMSVASLAVRVRPLGVQNIIFSKMLTFAVSACDVSMMIDYQIPKTFRIKKIFFLVQCQITVQSPHEFWNGTICVLVVQGIFRTRSDEFKKSIFIKLLGGKCEVLKIIVAVIFGNFIKFVKTIIHSAIFNFQDFIF